MSEKQKIQNRIMGEYSIAKSYKGILRISHIIDLVTGEKDEFLNPRYYGTPNQLLNISGGTYSSPQKGVQSAAHSLKGDETISRYNIPDDELKNRRVPLTDSMGNFMNWYVGADGVTIGSDENINGTSLAHEIFYQKEYINHPIYQQLNFPVLKSNEIVIGRENKLYSTQKNIINESSLKIIGENSNPKLIIQNLYDKSNYDSITAYRTDANGNEEKVELRNYKPIVGTDKPYKKLRTIYNNTKSNIDEYDVLMYRQNDWDCYNYGADEKQSKNGWEVSNQKKDKFIITTTGQFENSAIYNKELIKSVRNEENLANDYFYKKGEILDCNADIVNIREYVLNVIKKFTQDNIVEVPSGTVIWQYCSLAKWRAYNDAGDDQFDAHMNYAGHRPTLQQRTDPEGNNNFHNSTLQGACKKINHIRKNVISNQQTKSTDSEEENVLIQDAENFYKEIIPLYKRDYLLCDGSVYRIPYFPNFKNSNLSSLNQHRERFFELFFNLGYRYTDRAQMLKRPRIIMNFDKNGNLTEGQVYLSNSQGQPITHEICKTNFINQPSSYTNNFNWSQLMDVPETNLWSGTACPAFTHEPQTYTELQDADVLFGEDLATMLALDVIYDKFKSDPSISYEKLREWCIKGQPLPQKYIFNSFIGDNKNTMQTYWANSYKYGEEKCPDVMEIYYYDAHKNPFKMLLGRQVNNLNSFIKFYDPEFKIIRIVKVYDLPLVSFFIHLLGSQLNDESELRKYCHTFYNFDFQVPNFTPQDNTPAFIGSSGYSESDENRCKLRTVVQWYTRYSHSTRPHRHAIFAGKTILDTLNEKSVPSIYGVGKINTTDPVNIAGFWGEKRFNFPSWNKKGGTTGKITEQFGNYIINQFYVKTQDVDVDGMNVKVLVNDGKNEMLPGDVSRNRYGWKTGGFRTQTPNDTYITNSDDPRQITANTSTIAIQSHAPSSKWLEEWDTNIDQKTIVDYYKYHRPSWYSLSQKEDPRFDTSEPNRGISSAPIEPIKNVGTIDITYKKLDANKQSYIPHGNAAQADCGFFSPEHVTMLPLIKI